ncbi:MAG: SDR family oxidoreductase [Anaerolineales bacterium]
MTTYFITGGLGFLGQYIVKAIHDYDPKAELRVLVRTQRKTFLGIEALEGVRWVHGELTHPETFRPHLQGVDVVIHNAAKVSFRRSDADAIYRSNVIGTHNLAQAALAAGCKRFIFVSSISAIGFNPDGPSDETTLPDMDYKRTHDMYGYTKRLSELELIELADRMHVIMLNPSVILGPGSERIRAVYRMARFLPVLPMLRYINSFVDVRDVAQAVILALGKGRSGERYVVTAWNVDMLTFTRLTLQLAGRKALLLPVSGVFLRLLDAVVWLLDLLRLNPGLRRISEMNVDKPFSNEKIQRELGWQPHFTLEQSIKDSVNAT